jgi:hypothetical protein
MNLTSIGLTINWWQAIIIVVIAFWLGFFTRTVTYKCPEIIPSIGIGTPDTISVATSPVTGESSAKVKARRYKSLEGVVAETSVKLDTVDDWTYFNRVAMFEKVTKDSMNGLNFRFRSRTYVWSPDSAYIKHEWDIHPKPCDQITIHDTIPRYVPTAVPVPFFEKPVVAYPLGVVAGMAVIYVLREIIFK